MRLGVTAYPDHTEHTITVEGGSQRASFTFVNESDFKRFAEKISILGEIPQIVHEPEGQAENMME
jgi:hypothetical protein